MPRKLPAAQSPTKAVPSDATAWLSKVKELREAMNQGLLAAPGARAAAEKPTSSDRIDISEDLEKDINIDAPISNNAACSITHHSNISINYYNYERPDGEDSPPPGLKRYTVWLPEQYVAALERLRRAFGQNQVVLARLAYGPLFRRFGIQLVEPELANKRAGRK